ncbi:MAG: peptidase carboxypeptidase [Bryobacterales bacterium]|nr:peptidase carboxypeptidase [Bryobacterales bacterium]
MRFKFFVTLSLAFCASAAVPTPKSHFGHEIGVDKVLLDWDQVVAYYHKLEKSSDRLRVKEIGKTAYGRPFIAVTISSPETMKNLDKYLEIQRRLADPRITSPAQAEPMFAQGKNVVLMTCSIHATEVASTHSAIEFAYKMLTEDSPRFQAIRQNTILILVPSLNPDGVDIVTQWYRKTLGTKFEGSQPPELWQKYVGHDNNRDWYIFSQPETRATISQLHNVWHPEIVYDVHQQGANASRIFIPPWLDPVEPNVDAIIGQEMNMIGTSMASDLTAAGKTGVAVNAAYDFWNPSRHYQSFHAGLRILTESASARLASPITLRHDQLATNPLGYNAQERSWNHLEPWAGGTWHLRDIIDYQEIAFESCLYNAAIHREDMLRNFYKVGQRAIARTTPWAFVIPAEQRDPGATRKMLETLAFGQVEIEKAPNGDRLIRMQQPYSSWAKALLERQNYPDLRFYPGGPPKRPYDVTAETLPLLFGVDVKTVDKPLNATLVKETYGDAPAATAFSASDTDAWKTANRIWKSGKPVWRDQRTGEFSASDRGAGWKKLNQPRIGLYKSFVPAMDEGWTRWILENFGFDYMSVKNADIQAGNLRAKYDVIVFADQHPDDLTDGFEKGSMPDEYTGGLGEKGAAALKDFTKSGGTLLFFNHSTAYAIAQLGVPAKNVLDGVANKDFYSPGSLLNVKVDTTSPLTRGLPAEMTIWSEQSPAFTSDQPSVMNYTNDHVLASGWLLGEKLLNGKSALVDAKLGEGHVILFGLRPQYRAQSYQAFKLFFNAITAYEQ